MSSGISRHPLAPDYDRETGLPFHDSGCIPEGAFNDAYNAAVHAWIKENGLPAGSVAPRILDAAVVDAALEMSTSLEASVAAHAPDGRSIERRGDGVHLEGGPFETPVDRPLGLAPGDSVRLAWASNGQVLLSIDGPKHEGFSGHVRVQIDPVCGCLIQVLR